MDNLSLDQFSFSSRLTHCPACQSDQLRPWGNSLNGPFSIGGFAHDQCLTCLTVFTNPRPEMASLADFYMHVQDRDSANFISASLNYYRDEVRRQSRIEDYLLPLLKYRRNGKLLDFGCGAGWFVAMARDAGFEAHGIEQMPEAVQAGREVLGLENLKIGDETAIPSQSSYDVIVSNNLIEHLLNPKQFADIVRTALNPGGLWMVNFPSADGLMFQILKQYSYYFMTPYHLTHFTKKGFQTMLEDSAFMHMEYTAQKEAFYWGRGLAAANDLQGDFENWRGDNKFVAFDIELDRLINQIALRTDQTILNELCFAHSE